MPRMDAETEAEPVKVIVAGDQGTGKTGLLASLAIAGYSLRILDYDNGTHVIKSILRKKDPSALSRVYAEVCTDTFKNVNGRITPKAAVAWARGARLMSRWNVGKEGEEGFYDLGPVTSWTPKDVLVIDSLTHMTHAAMRYHQSLNSKLGSTPTIQDRGIIQSLMEELFASLLDKEVQCNVVVNAHIDWRYKDIWNEKRTMVVDRELIAGNPAVPGLEKFPKIVGSYFNNLLQMVVEGSGTARRYKLVTVPATVLNLKTSSPFTVEKSYPVETGLADFFRDIRGEAK